MSAVNTVVGILVRGDTDYVTTPVNGNQILHRLKANFTFYDSSGATTIWAQAIPTLPDDYTLGNVIFGFGSTPLGSTNWRLA
jgi:hypothetical protein